MLWLFGQIWLWLLVAFLLGAVVTWALLSVLRREKTAEPAPEQPDEPIEAPDFSQETPAERTQYIPAARFDGYEAGDGYEDEPRNAPYDQETEGHREGVLPQASGAPPSEEPEWTNEQNGAEDEPAWPRPEDLPASEHRPGRGG